MSSQVEIQPRQCSPRLQQPDAYDFAPLEHDDQIRLLDLEPGEGDDGIRCNLRTVDLDKVQWSSRFDHDDDAASYQALSYVWGNPKITLPIVCSENTLQITANLHAALKRLRLRNQARVLWVDAICINQKNNSERNHQVRRLRQIYSGASEVVIWLGESDAPEPFKIVGPVLSAMTSDADLTLFSLPDGLDWESFAEFFDSEWWDRKWVVQEFVFAQAIKFCKGASQYNIRLKRPGIPANMPENEDLGDGILISQLSLNATLTGPESDPSATALAAMDRISHAGTLLALWVNTQLLHTGWTTAEVLLRTSRYRVTLRPDHIIAVLNLGSDLSEDDRAYLIDYNLELSELIMRTANTIVGKEGLNVLEHSTGGGVSWQSQSISLEGDVPSWVPCYLFRDTTLENFRLCKMKESPRLPLKPIRERLYVRGSIVGQLSTLAPPSVDQLFKGHSQYRQRLLEWLEYLNTSCQDITDSHLQFWRLMLTFVSDGSSRGASMLNMEYHDQLVQSIFNEAFGFEGHEIRSLEKTSVQELLWGLASDMALFTLCCTKEGHLGFATQEAKPADLVFICDESESHHLVIRKKSDGEYAVLGCSKFVVTEGTAPVPVEEIVIS